MPYEKVCASYKYLEDNEMLSFESLKKLPIDELTDLMRRAKLRFPKMTAEYLYHNVRAVDGEILLDMSRDDIVAECWGFGYKLASMFCNRCKGTQYAIIDTHIDRYLKDCGCTAKTYPEKEKFFVEIARTMGKTPGSTGLGNLGCKPDWKQREKMTLDHDIVRSVIKVFPTIPAKEYTSLPELSRDIETLRECHAFFQKMANGDPKLAGEVDELILAWRRDLNARLVQMMTDRGQKRLNI